MHLVGRVQTSTNLVPLRNTKRTAFLVKVRTCHSHKVMGNAMLGNLTQNAIPLAQSLNIRALQLTNQNLDDHFVGSTGGRGHAPAVSVCHIAAQVSAGSCFLRHENIGNHGEILVSQAD